MKITQKIHFFQIVCLKFIYFSNHSNVFARPLKTSMTCFCFSRIIYQSVQLSWFISFTFNPFNHFSSNLFDHLTSSKAGRLFIQYLSETIQYKSLEEFRFHSFRRASPFKPYSCRVYLKENSIKDYI